MSSQIEGIYTAIASFAPYYDTDVAVACRKPQELKDQKLDKGPVRMLFLPEDAPGAFVAMGTSLKNTWVIIDRLFYKPTRLVHREDDNALMRDYIASYLDHIRSNRAPTAQSHIAEWSFSVRTDMTYGSNDTQWFGVDVTLTIEEFVT